MNIFNCDNFMKRFLPANINAKIKQGSFLHTMLAADFELPWLSCRATLEPSAFREKSLSFLVLSPHIGTKAFKISHF
jgi:hypothetical protein